MSYQENQEPDEAFISYQEKSIIVSMFTTILSVAVYSVVVWQRYQAMDFTTTNEFKFWAAVILIVIPVLIVAQLIAQILLAIANAIITREEEMPISDEMDRLIDLKATRNFYHVFMVGFVLAMGSQVINMSPTVMFVTLFASMIVAGVLGDVFRLYFYRRGF